MADKFPGLDQLRQMGIEVHMAGFDVARARAFSCVDAPTAYADAVDGALVCVDKMAALAAEIRAERAK